MRISSGPLLNYKLPTRRKSRQQKSTEAVAVPSTLSRPRSFVSSVNRVFKALEKCELLRNPLPQAFQASVSALGGLFAALNITGELLEGDVFGALEDTANGAVSLHGGAKLLTASTGLLHGFGVAGVVLTGAFALHDFAEGDMESGVVRGTTGLGLALTLSGALPAQVVGLMLLAGTGLYRIGDAVSKELDSDENEKTFGLGDRTRVHVQVQEKENERGRRVRSNRNFRCAC